VPSVGKAARRTPTSRAISEPPMVGVVKTICGLVSEDYGESILMYTNV
jgi:hypothetical protein